MLKSIMFMSLIAVAATASTVSTAGAQSSDGEARIAAAQTRWAHATQPTLQELADKDVACLSLSSNSQLHIRFDKQIEAVSTQQMGRYNEFFRPDGRELRNDDSGSGHYEIRKESATKFLINQVQVTTTQAAYIPTQVPTAIPERAPTPYTPTQAKTTKSIAETYICELGN